MDVIKVILVMPFVTNTMLPMSAARDGGGQIPLSLFRLRLAEIRSLIAMLIENYGLISRRRVVYSLLSSADGNCEIQFVASINCETWHALNGCQCMG